MEPDLSINIGVLTMTDHVGALLQVLLQRFRLGGEVGHHARLQDPRKDLNLLRGRRYARYFSLNKSRKYR